MKKPARIITLLLACAMIVSIAACSGGDAGPSASNPVVSNPGSSPSSTPSSSPIQIPEVSAPPTDMDDMIVVDSITYGFRNPSWDMSPWKNSGNSGQTVYLQLYSCLMANPAYGTPLEKMQYDIAESITFSGDRMIATIKLRDYVHDSKGNPIKAEDVVFSYLTAPIVSGNYSRVGTFIESVVAKDELTVEIKAATSAPGTWELLLSNCPIVNKNWYENASADERANNPAGTGAYRVVENVAGSSIILEAIEDFWQKDELRSVFQRVTAKTINYVSITEDSMRVIALERGELDAAIVENVNYDRFLGNSEFNIFQFLMTNPSTILLNCAEGKPFNNNAALRLAVLHAIDFDEFRIAVSGELSASGHDIAPVNCGDYDPAWNDMPYFDYDPDLAAQYMIEAGYGLNSGLTLHFMFRNMPHQVAAATVMQSYLAEIGINLLLDGYDQSLYDTYLADPTQWDLVWYSQMNSTGFVTDSWNFYFSSRGEQGTAGFVKDDKLQQLLQAALTKNDAASRNAFRDYYIEQGYGANAAVEMGIIVGRKEITNMWFSFISNPIVNAFEFDTEF